MNSIETCQEHLREELAAVDNAIKDHNEQIELLAKRVEALKRALELFGSDQSAIAELLRTSAEAANGSRQMPERSAPPSAKVSAAKAAPRSAAPKAEASAPRQLGVRAQKAAQKHLDEVRAANQSGKVKRPDLIAAVCRILPGSPIKRSSPRSRRNSAGIAKKAISPASSTPTPKDSLMRRVIGPARIHRAGQ